MTGERPRPSASRFLLGFVSVSAGNYGAIAVSFLISVTLTRALGPQEFGRVTLLLTLSQVLVLLVSSWTLTGLVRFGAREYAKIGSIAETFWSRTILVVPPLAAAVTALSVFAGPLASVLQVRTAAVGVVGLHVVVAATFATAAGTLQALGRMPRYGAMLISDRSLALVAIVLVSQLGALDAPTVIVIYAVSSLVVAVWTFRSVDSVVLFPPRVRRAVVDALWTFSLPVAASSWAGLLGTQWIDYVMIRYFLDVADVGHYALAYQVAGALLQAAIIMSTLLLPRFSVTAQRGPDALRREVDRLLPYWLLGFSLVAAVAVVAAGPAVPLVFGADFAAAVPPLALLLVATSLAAVASNFQALLSASAIMWPMSAAILAAVATNVALNAVLIPRLGISGAAAATLVSYGLSAGIMLRLARLHLGLPTLRYALFAVPPTAVYVSSLALEGPARYLTAVGALLVCGLAISRAFGLFQGPVRILARGPEEDS